MKPLIGINVDIEGGPPPHMEVQTTYVVAIQQAGGIPIMLPPMNDEDLEQVCARLSGLLLIGGVATIARRAMVKTRNLASS